VLEVDRWWRAAPPGGPRLVEVHPEVSFAAMAGRPLAHRKKSWAGALERWELLAARGVALRGACGEAGALAAVDDLLDAAAVAWTALRVARGAAVSHPCPPERTPDGWPAAIWA
jgi:predicted RNase H-like nuclease